MEFLLVRERPKVGRLSDFVPVGKIALSYLLNFRNSYEF